jgi:hypothetical protein
VSYVLEVNKKLERFLGQAGAERLISDCLRELGYRSLKDFEAMVDPQDLLDFGTCLIKQAGIVELIGRSVRVYAINRGARLADAEQNATLESVKY